MSPVRRGARGRRALPALPALVVLVVVAACQPTLEQETGIVLTIDSPGFGQVDGFELLTGDGRTLHFDTTGLEFRAEFPASHVNEHRLLADPIVVTFRTDGERRLVTQLDDAE